MCERERHQHLTDSATDEDPNTNNVILPIINNEEISEFLGDTNSKSNCQKDVTIGQKRTLVMEQALNYLNQMSGLDNNSFSVFEKNFQAFINKNNKVLKITGSKRKFENQTYYPEQKRKKK